MLSGPTKIPSCESKVRFVQVNLIASSREERVNLENDAHKLWNLETLGITETEDEVLETFEIVFPSQGTGTPFGCPGRRGIRNS